MPRRVIALLIALYAIAFAFGAMAAIRWPSLMMVAGFMLEDDAMAGLSGIDWRELGIAYGAPYFLSALCLYAAALSLGNKHRSALLWYLMGVAAGFPCVFLVDFEPGWWQDPSAGEGAVAGAAGGALLLGIAVWELCRKPKQPAATKEVDPDHQQVVYVQAPDPAATAKPVAKHKYRRPVPAAIARQRAHFAAEGRKMMARRRGQ
ncbi:MAG: hypothetical protein AAFP81_18370 [Pseudomonadota bacterium]